MDDTGGMYGAMCALTGLYHRNMTGRGQHIDQAQMISSIPMNGPALLDFTVNGRGSRRPGFPPGKLSPLARHVAAEAISVTNRRAAQRVPHRPRRIQRLVRDSLPLRRRMGTSHSGHGRSIRAAMEVRHELGRLEHQDELDANIETWSLTLGKYGTTERCQAAGVRAMPVQSAEDRVEHDPQLRDRAMYLPVEHPALGTHKVQNAPFRMSSTPAVNHTLTHDRPTARAISPKAC